ncbi:RNA polymerase sigma-70 factor [uncultured Bacteroides sp.]|uniref:RNA polymerase sigma factor n=1 Tax=uncultured Bacteroides sp. TaxID=162156 RepID=UPI0025F0AA29|nr:RNA polymerase sigma-70 factor [uncultured Bacteroides sp.]
MEKHIDNIEERLISALKLGSGKAFDSIYQMYSKRLYAYCLQFTKSPEESEEIVQDVFVKLWQNRTLIRQNETLRSLLFIMAKHQLINAYRSKVNHPVYEEFIDYKDTLSVEDAHTRLEYNEFKQAFQKAIDSLPDTQRKVISLSRIHQLSNKEIAEKLSLSEQTVKNQISLGLKVLKEKLNKILWIILLLFIN